MRKRLYLIGPLLLLLGCKPKTEWLKYSNEKAGFSINYPADWKPNTQAEIRQNEEKGLKAIKDALPDSTLVDDEEMLNDHENLLDLQRDVMTSFNVTSQAYTASDGSYAEQQAFLFKLILDTYASKGMPVSSMRSSVKIDKLDFEKLDIKVFDRDKKTIVVRQQIYDRLFEKKFSISMTFTYASTDDEAVINEMLKSAHFAYRN